MIFIMAAKELQAREAAFNSKLDRTQWRFLYKPEQLRGWRGHRVLLTETAKVDDDMAVMLKDRQCRVTHIKIKEGFKPLEEA